MTKEERVTRATENTKNLFKSSIYDILSIATIVAIFIISLDMFGIRKINFYVLGDIFIEWVPFFLASILLDNNLYEKGKYVGKNSEAYINAVLEYSKKAAELTGKKLTYFSIFCNEKNKQVLREKQAQKLQRVGISIEDYEKDIVKYTDKQLKEQYDEETVNIINEAKNIKIVGLKVNSMLGSYDTDDETDFGPDEEKISKNYKTKRAIISALSTIVMTFIGIKNIATWGWAGMLIVLFKTSYTFAKAYIAYFKGYNDVAIVLTNQFIRKTDVFKEYDYWFEINVINVGNNL